MNRVIQRLFALLSIIIIICTCFMIKDNYSRPKIRPQFKRATLVFNSRIEVQDRQLEYKTIKKEDSNLEIGKSIIVQSGETGLLRTTYRLVYREGILFSKNILATNLIKESKDKIIRIGTKQVNKLNNYVAYSNSNVSRGNMKAGFTVTATAYTHTGNRTATGIWPHKGIIAVDPKVIPLGTRLFVEGYGEAIASDTGGAIKGSKIDVFYDTYDECIQWGRKKVRVYILQ